MLLTALALLIIPCFIYKNQNRLLASTFAVLFSLFSILLYLFSSHPVALKYWLTEGKEHYELIQTFERLGGVEGAITRIHQKLMENPENREGWIILGKLYLANQDESSAEFAFSRARALEATP
jgi:cytochrome c-type biogenesis protein CcmH/NrfG